MRSASQELEVCEQRDPKGCTGARGPVPSTGSPASTIPTSRRRIPDLVLDGTKPIPDGVAALEALLRERGLL
jgi:hypothetical protein